MREKLSKVNDWRLINQALFLALVIFFLLVIVRAIQMMLGAE